MPADTGRGLGDRGGAGAGAGGMPGSAGRWAPAVRPAARLSLGTGCKTPPLAASSPGRAPPRRRAEGKGTGVGWGSGGNGGRAGSGCRGRWPGAHAAQATRIAPIQTRLSERLGPHLRRMPPLLSQGGNRHEQKFLAGGLALFAPPRSRHLGEGSAGGAGSAGWAGWVRGTGPSLCDAGRSAVPAPPGRGPPSPAQSRGLGTGVGS